MWKCPLWTSSFSGEASIFFHIFWRFKSHLSFVTSWKFGVGYIVRAEPPAALKGHELFYFGLFSAAAGGPVKPRTNCFSHSHESPPHTLKLRLKPDFFEVDLISVVNYTPRCRAESQRYAAGFDLNPGVRLHHSPFIRSPSCPHFLSHSWLAETPMTLCCCVAVLF